MNKAIVFQYKSDKILTLWIHAVSYYPSIDLSHFWRPS